MKKSLLMVFAVFIATISCRKNENHSQNAQTPLITLNGIAKETAVKMVQHYLDFRNNDLNPAKTSVWFDSTTVNRITRLLESEGADGLRIYFISDLGSSSHLKYSIALVSTKANGANSSVPSGTWHTDYYEHNMSNIVFSNLNAIKGTVTYNESESGALLYKTSSSYNMEEQSQPNNHHHIARKVAEQMVQHFGGHSINTNSEWFDLGLFKAIAADKNYDGIGIYFATKLQDMEQGGSDAFVIIKTIAGPSPGTHVDYFGSNLPNGTARFEELADGGQDNGEQCPDNCTGATLP